MILSTIGYEGLSLEIFFSILLENDVKEIVDVRELPLSRKAGFSKKALIELASKYSISYCHLKSLGCPKVIRHDYRSDNDWDRYSTRFLAYLETQNSEIKRLAELSQNKKCCLLCFEADASHCHRSFVADEIAKTIGSKLDIKHLVQVT